MVKKMARYVKAASNNIQVASAKMERHSEGVLEKSKAAHAAEFGETITIDDEMAEKPVKAKTDLALDGVIVCALGVVGGLIAFSIYLNS